MNTDTDNNIESMETGSSNGQPVKKKAAKKKAPARRSMASEMESGVEYSRQLSPELTAILWRVDPFLGLAEQYFELQLNLLETHAQCKENEAQAQAANLAAAVERRSVVEDQLKEMANRIASAESVQEIELLNFKVQSLEKMLNIY